VLPEIGAGPGGSNIEEPYKASVSDAHSDSSTGWTEGVRRMDITLCIVGIEEEDPDGRTLRISLCMGLEEVARHRKDGSRYKIG